MSVTTRRPDKNRYHFGVLVGMGLGGILAGLDAPMWLWMTLIVMQAVGTAALMWIAESR